MKRGYKDGFFFHRQERIGKGKSIKITKIRTMKKDAHSRYKDVFRRKRNISRQDFNKQNITKIGKFLRATKIDEAPQIISFLKKDLRLIGIRPLAKKDYQKLPKESKKLYDKYGPGLFAVYSSIPRGERTRERIHEEYKKFYEEVKKSPFKTNTKYLSKIFWLYLKKPFQKNKK